MDKGVEKEVFPGAQVHNAISKHSSAAVCTASSIMLWCHHTSRYITSCRTLILAPALNMAINTGNLPHSKSSRTALPCPTTTGHY